MVDRITAFLDSHGVAYRCVHHEPTRTSEESAKARGEPLEVGGKTIVMKVGEEFMLFVFSAARRIDSQKIKAHFGVKKIRFASAEELHQLTGLVPGSVPPFGKPLLPFELFVDTSISLNDRIAFNAGSLTDSIVMNSADYLRFANGVTFDFAE
jgi:prolyl-tRNA editing enzyme YbaK/EbsC (Cys-tRNA(Pro) deacylase)